MANFVIPRHPGTILVIDFTNPDNLTYMRSTHISREKVSRVQYMKVQHDL